MGFVFIRTHMISHIYDSFERDNSDIVTNDGTFADDFTDTIPAPDFESGDGVQGSSGGGDLPHFTVVC